MGRARHRIRSHNDLVAVGSRRTTSGLRIVSASVGAKLRILRWPRGSPILSEVAPGGVEKADISLSCNEIK